MAIRSRSGQRLKPIRFYFLYGTAEEAAEKVSTCHSEGRGLPEESAVLLSFAKKQIPRFARDDNKSTFSAACEAVPYKHLLVATAGILFQNFHDTLNFSGHDGSAH